LWLAPLAFLALFYFFPLGSLLSLSFSRSAEGPAAPFLSILTSHFMRGVIGFTFGQALSTPHLLLGSYAIAGSADLPGDVLRPHRPLLSCPLVVAAAFSAPGPRWLNKR
jgi:hypothetical protein